MKKALLLIFSFASFSAFAAVDLNQAFQAALEKTEPVAIQRAKVDQVQAREDQAFGKLLPNLSLNANYLKQDVLNNSSSTGYPTEQTNSRLSLSQSIFQAKDWAGLGFAKTQTRIEKQNLSVETLNLYTSVADSFYEVLTAEQEIRNLKETIQATKDRAAELQKRIRIGRSRTGELSTAQAQVAVAQANMSVAMGQLKLARDKFNSVTGLPRETEVAEPGTILPPNQSVDFYVQKISERPDLRSLEEVLTAARQNVRMAKAGHLPSVSLNGNYYLSRSGYTNPNDWDVGVGLTFPLYEGGITQALVREATALENQARLTLEKRKREIENEVRSAYSTLASNIDQIKTLQVAVQASEKNYREQERDYRFSLVTNLDVLQALTTYQDSKRALDRVRYQSFQAWAELQKSVGVIPNAGRVE